MYNPSLREEPREQLADVIPVRQETSLLDWLETNGRLIARDAQDDAFLEDEEEISELMGVDDSTYDDDDDDLDDDIDDE
jgi:phosphopantothenoylcysteine synthetase/decarboxylase